MSKVWLETHTTKKICSIISPATLLPKSLLARHMISTTTRVGGFLQRWLLTSIWVDLVGQIYPPIYPNSLGIRQRTLFCSELSGVLQARVTSRNCGYITITKNPSQIVSVLVDNVGRKSLWVIIRLKQLDPNSNRIWKRLFGSISGPGRSFGGPRCPREMVCFCRSMEVETFTV